MFIGFTATPLMRKDKKRTQDIFGTYIDTYKFHEGVADRVVLDLKYEARDVPQRLTTQDAVDQLVRAEDPGAERLPKGVVAPALGNDAGADERRRSGNSE